MKNLSNAVNDAYSKEYSELLTKIERLQSEANQCLQHIGTCADAQMVYDLTLYEIEKLAKRCEDIRKIPTGL